jgi:hypothetical protein
MKDIKQYTCTLKQAKRLKELGVEKNSLFSYTISENFNDKSQNIGICPTHYAEMYPLTLKNLFSTFTSQELGELIDIWCDENRTSWHQRKTLKTKIDDYYFYLEDQIVFNCGAISESHARAQFLIDRLERKRRK